jgi:hypothetical protein
VEGLEKAVSSVMDWEMSIIEAEVFYLLFFSAIRRRVIEL